MQGGCVPFTGELLRISLTEGIGDRVLNKLNSAYKQRVKLLCDILQTDSRIEIDTTPQGGYFVWVAFPGVATEEFLGICMREGVKFLPGGRCDPFKGEENVSASRGLDHNEFKSHARLCFADMDLEEIENGAKLLVLCYQEMAGPDIP
jgi:DNA-binding transcriptional MocR family regulator